MLGLLSHATATPHAATYVFQSTTAESTIQRRGGGGFKDVFSETLASAASSSHCVPGSPVGPGHLPMTMPPLASLNRRRRSYALWALLLGSPCSVLLVNAAENSRSKLTNREMISVYGYNARKRKGTPASC